MVGLFCTFPGNFDPKNRHQGVEQQGNGLPQRREQNETSQVTAADPEHNHDISSLASTVIGRGPTEDDEIENAGVVHALARELTRQNTRYASEGVPRNPFTSGKDEDPLLDPNSPDFSAVAWAKTLVHVQSRDPERYPRRTAGVAFRSLSVHGFGLPTDFQKDVGNIFLEGLGAVRSLLGLERKQKIQILRDYEGVLESGEMLVVLGRPGSGCSTFLKTIAGETNGLYLDRDAYLNYQGISATEMNTSFRGEAIYTAETDIHFPNLSVGDTLSFAAQARAPRNRLPGVTRAHYGEHMRDVVMALYGLGHTINTRVGNDFVRGVSGGERKRVSIAEATLSGSPLQCWDNSTRGLDSANALEFCKTLRLGCDIAGSTVLVAIYQASQSAYDVFDKVIVLYEGRQIYFGRANEARDFFTSIGFHCPPRQTTADFLTSLTSAAERVVQPGFENQVPRTPDEFAEVWKKSEARAKLMQEVEAYEQKYPIGGNSYKQFVASRKAQKSKRQRAQSPYTISYVQQVLLCLRRGFQRLRGDPSLTLTALFGNFIMALIIGSVFYNLPSTTGSFYSRGALLFFAILMNAFGSALEILTLYAQRPIVEKHSRYALYHPSAEAIASMLCDMPYKISNAICFNLVLYFMSNLRREPGPFFFFLLMSFFCTLTMSMIFRTIASASRTLSQAMAPAALMILALVIFTGFVIPTRNMLGWSRWINYIDPIAYAFESLLINEFHGRTFDCSVFVPAGPTYQNVGQFSRICSQRGAVAGSSVVDGDAYINASFQYSHAHKWRNFGILIGFMLLFMGTYVVATEFISAKKSKGEVLLFRIGYRPQFLKEKSDCNEESSRNSVTRTPVVTENDEKGEPAAAAAACPTIEKQTAVFQWQDVCYDIKIKGEPRRILDHVDGWVKPGTLTALMGVSGAGKTTLLDVLATRVTMGVVSGEMLVDGRSRDASFQRRTGYVQQQDLHLSTTTVREALEFSALLRQPKKTPRKEKLAYVDEVIKILEMGEYADAVVGVPGEGLNVEQRKRLTVGVELVAKPQLLLFLDEPTSGLDSQTSWAICDLMEKLTKAGQAILCTIHQPSAMLFQRFDRLLFLAKGGKTVYYGEIGENSSILTTYFERNGAPKCPEAANPAEWMLEIIGAAPGSRSDIDWPQVWTDSPERREVRNHLAMMKEELPKTTTPSTDKDDYNEFAAPFIEQLSECLKRVFSQYWRTPSYIYSKFGLCASSALFIGFAFFNAKNSIQGLQNQMFSIFMLMTIFGNLVQQIMPHFVTQRALYEVRERPSKSYSWKAFMMCNIIVELPWNSLMAVIIFLCWYYPIGFYKNAISTDAVHERGALMFLLIWSFLVFTSTFTNMVIAGIDSSETGGNIAVLSFSLTLIFCGVLATPSNLPGFWIFMYRVSPFTYLIGAMLSVAVANTDVTCEPVELVYFEPTNGTTCGAYMADYIKLAGGYLTNPEATTSCGFCSVSDTNTFLASVVSFYSERWRNFGIMWAYVIFNICCAVFIYWLVRVPKNPGRMATKEKES